MPKAATQACDSPLPTCATTTLCLRHNMSRDVFNLRTNTSLGKVDLDFSANYTFEDVKNRPALGDSKSNIGKNLMTLATTYDQNG
jgi:hypothetical protein